jgi:hypothetical protein
MATEPMPIVPGEACESPTHRGDCLAYLDWYDGPMLMLYREGDALYLVAWAGSDDTTHRWLAARVSRERFDAFGDGAITIAAMFSQPEDGNLIVLDAHCGATFRCVRVKASELPADLLPGDVAFPRSQWHEQPKLDGDTK